MTRPHDRYYPQSEPVKVCPNCELEYKGSPDWLTCPMCLETGCEECFPDGRLCEPCYVESDGG
jgi:hypothetical protein